LSHIFQLEIFKLSSDLHRPTDLFTHWAKRTLALLSFASLTLVASCGGGGGGGSSSVDPNGPSGIFDSFGVQLTNAEAAAFAFNTDSSSGNSDGGGGADGSAGDGAPIPFGTVTITDRNGLSVTAQTDANGYYRAKIAGFTAPFVAKVVLGKRVRYSLNIQPVKKNGFITINLTGLTEKVASDVSVAAGGTGAAVLTPAMIATNLPAVTQSINNLNISLTAQLTANGLNPNNFNPITLPFKTDRTGYDAVLDTTIVSTDNTGKTFVVPNGNIVVPGLDTTGIATFVSEFNRLNASASSRSGTAFADLIDANFLDEGSSKTAFLSNFLSGTDTVGLEFFNTSVIKCSTTTMVCALKLNIRKTIGPVEYEYGVNLKYTPGAAPAPGVWRMYGDQVGFEYSFTSMLQRTLTHTTPSFTPGAASYAAAMTLDIEKTSFGSALLQYYGTSLAPQGSPITLASYNTKVACTAFSRLPLNNGDPNYCGNADFSRNDTQLTALNNDFATAAPGALTLRITVYSGANFTGTSMVANVMTDQRFLLSSQGSSFVYPTYSLNTSGFTATFTTPSNLYHDWLDLRATKRSLPIPNPATLSSSNVFWGDDLLAALGGVVSLSSAATQCTPQATCPANFTGVHNPQITRLESMNGIYGVTGQALWSVNNYTYLYP
jgi:hypothetical protein